MSPPVTIAVNQRATFAKTRSISWQQIAVWGVIAMAAAGISAAFVYFKIFSIFQSYDDEGFILLSLKSFVAGKPLYDEVYSSFQPAFYVFYWLFFAISGASVIHDNIRLVTLVVWIVAATLNGLITHRLTRSALLGLLVGVVSVRMLESFANEPGHPQAMACVLVEGIVALCAYSEALPPRSLAIGLGALIGLAVLTKINIGVFVALPLALLVASGSSGKLSRAIQLLISLVMLSLPSLLWRTQLGSKGTPIWSLLAIDTLACLLVAGITYNDRRVLHKATLALFVVAFTVSQTTEVSVAALPVYNAGLLTLSISAALLICGAERDWIRPGLLSWKLGYLGLAVVVASILFVVVLRGTTVHGLATGLFIWPARVSASFLIRPRSNGFGPLLGLMGALACYWYIVGRRRFGNLMWFRRLILCGQINFGLLVLAEYYFRRPGSSTLMPLHSDLPHFWMLPFAWLVVPSAEGNRSMLFGRLALLMIAVMQPLIACPVAGTQLVPASILLVAVAAVCLGDGLAALIRTITPRLVLPWPRLSLEVVGAIVLLVPFTTETLQLRDSYTARKPLDLPGASRIRLTPEEVSVYHQVVKELAKPDVETFFTLPGMDSLYLWSHKEPPNGLNVSAWIILLDGQEQERVWQAAQHRSGLKVVRNRRLIRSWVSGRSVSQLPLVRHIDESFTLEVTYGGYEILAPRQKE